MTSLDGSQLLSQGRLLLSEERKLFQRRVDVRI